MANEISRFLPNCLTGITFDYTAAGAWREYESLLSPLAGRLIELANKLPGGGEEDYENRIFLVAQKILLAVKKHKEGLPFTRIEMKAHRHDYLFPARCLKSLLERAQLFSGWNKKGKQVLDSTLFSHPVKTIGIESNFVKKIDSETLHRHLSLIRAYSRFVSLQDQPDVWDRRLLSLMFEKVLRSMNIASNPSWMAHYEDGKLFRMIFTFVISQPEIERDPIFDVEMGKALRFAARQNCIESFRLVLPYIEARPDFFKREIFLVQIIETLRSAAMVCGQSPETGPNGIEMFEGVVACLERHQVIRSDLFQTVLKTYLKKFMKYTKNADEFGLSHQIVVDWLQELVLPASGKRKSD